MRKFELFLIWSLAFVCLFSSRNALADQVKTDFHLTQAHSSVQNERKLKAWEEYSMALYHEPLNLEALNGMSKLAVDIDRVEDTLAYWDAALALTNSEAHKDAYRSFKSAIAVN